MGDDNFRIQAKKFFLTYPQCSIGKATASEAIHARYSGEIASSVFAEERHQDGNEHIHAMVEFKRTKNIKSSKAFDIGEYHPNIQACKDLDKVLKYITKEGMLTRLTRILTRTQ